MKTRGAICLIFPGSICLRTRGANYVSFSTDWQKATASPRAWLAHQKKNYQLHAKLTQIEGIVKAHLAKVNFDREALDMDVRYISEPEKVDAELVTGKI